MTQQSSVAPRRRWLWLIFAFTALATVIGWLSTTEDTIDISHTEAAPPLPIVSFETVTPQPASISISAFAEVRPRWSAELKAAVSGRITEVTDAALAGSHVEAGKVLIRQENSPYIAEVAQAEQALADARRQLLRAESKTTAARRQYKNRGTRPANELALHLPELRVAKKTVAAAEARLNAARLTLQNATTRAPFSGFITERMVSPGQTVNTGDTMIRLVDDSQLELTVELSRKEWALLQQPVAGRQAQLYAEDNRLLGHADIRQGGGFLDQKSRQYRVFMEISNAAKSPVLSGDFVRLELQGITMPDALNIPASALTQAGKLWYLDRNNQLQHLMPDVISRMQSRLIIRNPDSQISSWRIATTPLAAFLPGMRVSGREE